MVGAENDSASSGPRHFPCHAKHGRGYSLVPQLHPDCRVDLQQPWGQLFGGTHGVTTGVLPDCRHHHHTCPQHKAHGLASYQCLFWCASELQHWNSAVWVVPGYKVKWHSRIMCNCSEDNWIINLLCQGPTDKGFSSPKCWQISLCWHTEGPQAADWLWIEREPKRPQVRASLVFTWSIRLASHQCFTQDALAASPFVSWLTFVGISPDTLESTLTWVQCRSVCCCSSVLHWKEKKMKRMAE